MALSRLDAFHGTRGSLFKLRGWSVLSMGVLGLITLAVLPRHALGQDPYAISPPPYDAPVAPPPALERMDMDVQAPEAPPAVDGQWVYTRQYGWVWMPYDQVYTHVLNDGEPSMYVYGPTFGWRWVAAPWVLSGGPEPYWGARGLAHFAWHARPWFARREYTPAFERGPRTVIVHDRRPVFTRDDRPLVIREQRSAFTPERRPAYAQEARANYRRDYPSAYRQRADPWAGHHEQPSVRRDYHRDERPNLRSDNRRDGRSSFGGDARRMEAPASRSGERRESFGQGRSSREVHMHGHSHGRR